MENLEEPPKLERQMRRRVREPGEAAARGHVPTDKTSKLNNVSIVNDFGLYGCPICGKMFVDQKFLTRHARTEHSSFKIVRVRERTVGIDRYRISCIFIADSSTDASLWSGELRGAVR